MGLGHLGRALVWFDSEMEEGPGVGLVPKAGMWSSQT